jgi:hypothetical protein
MMAILRALLNALVLTGASALHAPGMRTALVSHSGSFAMPLARRVPVLQAKDDYTEVQKLRAEVESPFSQVRLFVFPALFAAASIATYFAATALLASSMGVRDPSPTGFQDLAIDVGSMAALGLLWRRETQIRESRLKRIAFGSKLAKLRVYQLVADPNTEALKPRQAVSLADLRRGRGQARRVVVLCAPADKLRASLEGACRSAAALSAADFLVVPLISSGETSEPQLEAPSLELLQELASRSGDAAAVSGSVVPVPARGETQPPLPWDTAVPDAVGGWPVALPQTAGPAWTAALSSELEQAMNQDGAVMSRGLTIVLKKNGRVGTRRLGTPDWDSMLADVNARKMAGLDTTNI